MHPGWEKVVCNKRIKNQKDMEFQQQYWKLLENIAMSVQLRIRMTSNLEFYT